MCVFILKGTMNNSLFFDQSEKNKFIGSLLICTRCINEIYNNPKNLNYRNELNKNITTKEKQKVIKNYIQTNYKKEWDNVNKGDFSDLIQNETFKEYVHNNQK